MDQVFPYHIPQVLLHIPEVILHNNSKGREDNIVWLWSIKLHDGYSNAMTIPGYFIKKIGLRLYSAFGDDCGDDGTQIDSGPEVTSLLLSHAWLFQRSRKVHVLVMKFAPTVNLSILFRKQCFL